MSLPYKESKFESTSLLFVHLFLGFLVFFSVCKSNFLCLDLWNTCSILGNGVLFNPITKKFSFCALRGPVYTLKNVPSLEAKLNCLLV